MKRLIAVALLFAFATAANAMPTNPWVISDWFNKIFPNPFMVSSVQVAAPVAALPANPWLITDWLKKKINPWLVS